MECKAVSSTSSSSSEEHNSIDESRLKIPLNESRLDMTISLVTLLASEASINTLINDQEIIYLPDQLGIMLPADKLVNDDVPWLSGPEYISLRSGCRLIHRSISTLVAEKFGVKSLRLFLLSKNLEQNLFMPSSSSAKDNEIESFGQAESLTNRLKTILDM